MRKLVFLPLLTLALACGDGNPLQPDDQASLTSEQPELMVSQAPGQNAKWSFQTVVTLVKSVDAGESWMTPSGVWHGKGLINEFKMDGDLNGSWVFHGNAHANVKTGMGRSIGMLIFIDITESDLGVGTFECRTSAKIENWPDFEAFIQYGNVTGCSGTGDFEGMKMKAYVTNVAGPGLGENAIYDFSGEIW